LIAYFDSSAFVKLAVPEEGSAAARDIFATAKRVHSSRLLVPEALAALDRARRSGRLGPRTAARAFAETRAALDEIEPIEVEAILADRAGELALEHGLRGYDAVHLASYETVATANTVLVAADGDLVRTAIAIGYVVTVPIG
jgi:predicted nucleic acid-binding protein